MHAHGRRRVWFTVDAIKLPPARRDSIVRITWDAIDTAYPEMRAGFQALEEQFGPFHLDKRFPHEVSGTESQKFILWFEQYANVDTATRALLTIPNTEGGFGDGFGVLTSNVEESQATTLPGITVYPIPARDYLYVDATGVDRAHIINGEGTIVKTVDLTAAASVSADRLRIDVSDLPSGLYVIWWESTARRFLIVR